MIKNNDSARRHCPRRAVSRSCQMLREREDSRSEHRIVCTSARNSCRRVSPGLSLSSGAMGACVVVYGAQVRVECRR